jgi:hypothetical protein
MQMDRQEQVNGRLPESQGALAQDSSAPGASAASHPYRGQKLPVVLSALTVVVGILAIAYLLLVPPPNGDTAPGEADTVTRFKGWAKPDLALLLSGQQHGYYQPCGCSTPQKGGLVRRYNFLQTLKQRGWPVVAVDLGDIAQSGGFQAQAMLKYTTSMKALDLIGYTAVGVGHNEMAMPLFNALGEYALNNPTPRVLAANLCDPEVKMKVDFRQANLFPWQIAEPPQGLRVGVVGLIAQSVSRWEKDPDLVFHPDNRKVLRKSLAELQEKKEKKREFEVIKGKIVPVPSVPSAKLQEKKVEFLVLLLQGSVEEAKECAKMFPELNVILCLSKVDEPPAVPEGIVGNTMIITVGHKGRYVGVVGAYHTKNPKKPFDLKYEVVAMTEEFDTPAGKEKNHPVMKLIEGYAREVKAQEENLLAKYPRSKHPVQAEFTKAKYVGSEACKKCHPHAYKVWKESPHSSAYDTLVKARNPSLRQYDAECVRCHVVGLMHETGYVSEKATPLLKHVGCESCHGPGSEHIKDRWNKEIRLAINPWKVEPDYNKRKRLIENLCVTCHDLDNDVHWTFDKWTKGKIIHMTPKDDLQEKDGK